MTVAKHGIKGSGASQPITQHPLFPAIVALWFGVALGIGSLLLSPALTERLIAATGLGHVLPMAAPPFGGTARILIAVVLAVLGAAIGGVLARRVSRPAAVLHTRRREAQADSSPVFAEEFDKALEANRLANPQAEAPVAEVLSAEAVRSPLPGRRRGLTAQDNPPSIDRTEPQILDVAEFDLSGFDAEPVILEQAQPEPQSQIEPAEPAQTIEAPQDASSSSLFAAYSRSHPVPSAYAPTPQDEPAEHAPASAPGWFTHEIGDTAPLNAEPEAEAEAYAAPDADSAAQRIAEAELDGLSQVELLERLAIAMERSRALRRAAPVATVAVAPFVEPVAEAVRIAPSPESAPAVEAPAAFEAPEAPAAPAPLAFTRLTLQPLAFDEPVQEAAPLQAEAAPAEPVASISPEPAPFAPPPRIPAALRPVSLDEDDDDEALPGYIPPRHIGLAASRAPQFVPQLAPNPDPAPVDMQPSGNWNDEEPKADEPEADDSATDEDGDALEQGYSSLLNLSRPSAARQSFIRIDEPEEDLSSESAVVFPGSDGHDGGPFSPPPSPLALPGAAAPAAPRLFDAPGRSNPSDTESALRAALATLQRMSGAA